MVKPTLREKKRYIAVVGEWNEIENYLKDNLSFPQLISAGVKRIKLDVPLSGVEVIRVNRDLYLTIRELLEKRFNVILCSGTIKSLNEKLRKIHF